MKVSNDWLAGIGTGLGVGAGAALITAQGGAVLAGVGVGLVAYVIGVRETSKNEDSTEGDGEDVATDGGTVPEETPQEAAPQKPAVLDVEVAGDRALASVERGDVSLVVEAPAGISAEELEQTLAGVPESIERTTERFVETTTMSANTTESDGSSDAEDTTDDDVGGGE